MKPCENDHVILGSQLIRVIERLSFQRSDNERGCLEAVYEQLRVSQTTIAAGHTASSVFTG
jgi:hypothetical protein